MRIPQSGFAGVDAEWRPGLYKYDESKLSIIQIAIEDNIYIFDMKSLDYSMYLDDTLKNIFSNTKIIKSGAGLKEDIRRIKQTTDSRFTFTKNATNLYNFEDYVNMGLAKLCET